MADIVIERLDVTKTVHISSLRPMDFFSINGLSRIYMVIGLNGDDKGLIRYLDVGSGVYGEQYELALPGSMQVIPLTFKLVEVPNE